MVKQHNTLPGKTGGPSSVGVFKNSYLTGNGLCTTNRAWEVIVVIFFDFILCMCTHIPCILCIFMFEKLINFIKFAQINLITILLCSFKSSCTLLIFRISWNLSCFYFIFFIRYSPFPSFKAVIFLL